MSLHSLPPDILILLPDFLHNIEDFLNLSSTCSTLKLCLASASPSTILRLVAAQARIFFRPSPHFLVAATARELGDWARQSKANDVELTTRLQQGIDALLGLALEKDCGLTLARIRQLHQMRYDIINPVTNIIDQCVGEQWYDVPDFWNGGRSDAYTISSEPSETFFHLAVYGELFGPDLESFLDSDTNSRKLSLETRLEYIKYCLPDFATTCGESHNPGVAMDPRRVVRKVGPYAPTKEDARRGNGFAPQTYNHNIALTWVIKSSRWRPHWKRFREIAGCSDFIEVFEDGWWSDEESDHFEAWKQRLLENVMICQGVEGLGMVSRAVDIGVRLEQWGSKVREWKARIAALEKAPEVVKIDRQATLEYPYLLGDLRVCCSGYVGGT